MGIPRDALENGLALSRHEGHQHLFVVGLGHRFGVLRRVESRNDRARVLHVQVVVVLGAIAEVAAQGVVEAGQSFGVVRGVAVARQGVATFRPETETVDGRLCICAEPVDALRSRATSAPVHVALLMTGVYIWSQSYK